MVPVNLLQGTCALALQSTSCQLPCDQQSHTQVAHYRRKDHMGLLLICFWLSDETQACPPTRPVTPKDPVKAWFWFHIAVSKLTLIGTDRKNNTKYFWGLLGPQSNVLSLFHGVKSTRRISIAYIYRRFIGMQMAIHSQPSSMQCSI